MSKPRNYICSGCQGKVAIPRGRRNLALEAVKEAHRKTCPSRRTQ